MLSRICDASSRTCVLVLVAAGSASIACERSQAAPTLKTLRVVTYSQEALHYRAVKAMTDPLRLRGIHLEVAPGTSFGNVRTLQRGDTDIAVAAADAVY